MTVTYHIAVLTEPIQVIDYCTPPHFPIAIGGIAYLPLSQDYRHVFYDLVYDRNSVLRAIQLQIGEDDLLSVLLLSRFKELDARTIQFSPCLRIWLGPERIGKEVGAEGFGDLLILEGEDGSLAIGFSSDW